MVGFHAVQQSLFQQGDGFLIHRAVVFCRLARNEVPVAATVYVDDVYVERSFAEETARGVRGLRAWVTNEYAHNGLRAVGEHILGRLLDMVRGRA